MKPFILKGLVKIRVFDADKLRRRIWDRTWLDLGGFGRQKAPKREAKRDPRGIKNETKITSKF